MQPPCCPDLCGQNGQVWDPERDDSPQKRSLLKITETRGGCLCGHIRFRAAGEAIFPHYCSCRQCQRWSGAPVVAWGDFPSRSLEWEGPGGAPALFRSSPGTQRAFCPRCGSTLAAIDDGSETVCLTLATLDDPDQFTPEAYSFKEQAPSWLVVEMNVGPTAQPSESGPTDET